MNFSPLKAFLHTDNMAGIILHTPQVKYFLQNRIRFKIDLDPGHCFALPRVLTSLGMKIS